MPRRRRIQTAHTIVYVVLRGRQGNVLFAGQGDFERFQLLLGRALVRCRARLLAYCWVPQAAHLVFDLADVSLESLMRRVAGPYSRYVHRERGRPGAIYQSRYRALVVEPDTYLLPLVHYVHCRPVATGLCASAEEYPWSSDHAYRGGPRASILSKGAVITALKRRDRDSVRAYELLMRQPEDPRMSVQFERGSGADPRVVGGMRFAMGLVGRDQAGKEGVISAQRILAAVTHWQNVPPAVLFARANSRRGAVARALVAWYALGSGAGNLAELARWFGVRRWTLRTGIERHRAKRPELFNVPLEDVLRNAESEPSLPGVTPAGSPGVSNASR